MSLELRELGVADLDRVLSLSRALFADENAPAPPERRHRIQLFEQLQRGSRAFVLESAGVDPPLAFALLRQKPARIEQFRVAPALRRTGIGQGFVARLLADVFSSAARVSVSVLDDNEGAVAFWDAVARRHVQLHVQRRPRPN